MLKPKILYFLNTPQPSNYDRQVAATLLASVSFRNIKNIKPDDAAEVCDGVAGVVIPTQYQDKPPARDAISAYNAKISAGQKTLKIEGTEVVRTQPTPAPVTL